MTQLISYDQTHQKLILASSVLEAMAKFIVYYLFHTIGADSNIGPQYANTVGMQVARSSTTYPSALRESLFRLSQET